ncbi:hypothetical protein COI43_28705, partial [Bacillus pseudomycoides]
FCTRTKYTIPSELVCMVISIKRIVYFFRLGGNSFSWLDSDGVAPYAHQPNTLEYPKTKISPHYSCL